MHIWLFRHNYKFVFLFILGLKIKFAPIIYKFICDFKVTNALKVSKSQIFVHEYLKINHVVFKYAHI